MKTAVDVVRKGMEHIAIAIVTVLVLNWVNLGRKDDRLVSRPASPNVCEHGPGVGPSMFSCTPCARQGGVSDTERKEFSKECFWAGK